jgi:hypothetical protein
MAHSTRPRNNLCRHKIFVGNTPTALESSPPTAVSTVWEYSRSKVYAKINSDGNWEVNGSGFIALTSRPKTLLVNFTRTSIKNRIRLIRTDQEKLREAKFLTCQTHDKSCGLLRCEQMQCYVVIDHGGFAAMTSERSSDHPAIAYIATAIAQGIDIGDLKALKKLERIVAAAECLYGQHWHHKVICLNQ